MNGIKKSILAGILIGLAVINNLQSKNPVIGALLFSFGLLTIIQMQSSLYTGKIGYILEIHDAEFYKENKVSRILLNYEKEITHPSEIEIYSNKNNPEVIIGKVDGNPSFLAKVEFRTPNGNPRLFNCRDENEPWLLEL